MSIFNPYEIKRITKNIPKSTQWDSLKDQVIFNLMLSKFQQNESIKIKLLNTGNKKLYEAVKDKHWGIGYSLREAKKINSAVPANNQTGKNLMLIRASYLK